MKFIKPLKLNRHFSFLQLKLLCIIAPSYCLQWTVELGRRSTWWLCTYKATYSDWQIPFYVATHQAAWYYVFDEKKSKHIACLREQLSTTCGWDLKLFSVSSTTVNQPGSALWFCKNTRTTAWSANLLKSECDRHLGRQSHAILTEVTFVHWKQKSANANISCICDAGCTVSLQEFCTRKCS